MPFESNPSPIPSASQPEDDLTLLRAVSHGSLPAWHEFLDRYAPLVFGVVRRHLVSENEDDVRDVYVGVLDSLYHGGIEKYRGDVRLSTWLIVFARSRALDHFRRVHGRRRAPAGYDVLGDFDRRVFHCHFVKRLPVEITIHLLNWEFRGANVDDLVDSIGRIEEAVDRRYLDRMEREHDAARSGVDSLRLLDYLLQMKLDYEEKQQSARPDAHMIAREKRAVLDRVVALVASLSPTERRVVKLRFEEGLSARDIAAALNLRGERRAYTIIDRVVRKLRRAMV
jgi:RNA polymerase sigma factor (sigma-70 family)